MEDDPSVDRSLAATPAYGLIHFENCSAHDHARQHVGNVYSTAHHYHLPSSLAFGPDDDNKPIIRYPRNSVQSYVERSIDKVPITTRIVSYLDPSNPKRIRPPVAVLLGMGGAGKTQIALRCCEIFSEDESARSLFWIDASSNHSISKSFADIAEELVQRSTSADVNLQREACYQNIGKTVQIVHKFLERHQPWVLVFDNFDQPDCVKPIGKLQTIRDYWPQKAQGAVLILSRNRECKRLGKQFDVGRMLEAECIQLLGHYIRSGTPEREKEQGNEGEESGSDEDDGGYDEEEECLKNVADTLGSLALAIDQAGAYIMRRNITVKQFLSEYNKRKVQVLRSIPTGSVWEYHRVDDRDEPVPLSVFTTWDMSFSCLSGTEDVKRQKQDFVTISAFLDSSQLHEQLFKHCLQCRKAPFSWTDLFLEEGKWSSFKFGDLIAELRDLSLLESSARNSSGECRFTIHPLVSEWIKRRLSPAAASAVAKSACILLWALVPDPRASEPHIIRVPGLRALTGHVSTCFHNCIEFVTDTRLATTGPLRDVGLAFADLIATYGSLDDALSITEGALQWKSRREEPWCPHYYLVAMLRSTQLGKIDQCDKAIKLLEQLREGIETISDISDDQRMQVGHGLGELLCHSHRFKDASNVLFDYHEKSIRVLGREHHTTASLLTMLASACREQGLLDQAEIYLTDAQSRLSSIHGSDCAKIAQVEDELRLVYAAKGEYERALVLCKDNVKKRGGKLGASHPDTLRWRLSLAAVLSHLERREDALEAVKVVVKQAPHTSAQIAGEAYSMLGVLHSQETAFDSLDEACSQFRSAISYFEKAGSLLSQEALECCENYTTCSEGQGMERDVEGVWRQILEEYEQREEVDYCLEARIFFGLFSSLQSDALSSDDAKRTQFRAHLDRSVSAAFEDTKLSHLVKARLFESAIDEYAILRMPYCMDQCSRRLVELWSQALESRLASTTEEVHTLEVARDVRLPSPIATICDYLIFNLQSEDRGLAHCIALSHGLLPFGSFLMQHGDRTNAQIAYEQRLDRENWERKLPQPTYSCLTCPEGEEDIVAPFWQCAVCPAVSLCGACYEIYRRMAEPIPAGPHSPSGCLGHEFFKIPRQSWIDFDEDVETRDNFLRAWLLVIKDRYRFTSNDLLPATKQDIEFVCARLYMEDESDGSILDALPQYFRIPEGACDLTGIDEQDRELLFS